MGIENELVDFLESTIKNGANKARDIEIVKFYYGLNESPWPTLEETASRFGVGTRERIRQLLNSKFRDNVSKDSIPSLKDLVNVLKSREYWVASEFEEEICNAGIIDKESHLKGIFNLIDDVNIDCGFEFFTSDLKRASRNSMASSKNIFLIKESSVKAIEKLFKKAQGLPGRCGIAKLNYLEDELGQYYSLVSLLIESSPTSWVREGRERTLLS